MFSKTPDYLRKIHILVVDNDFEILELMQNILKCLGFHQVSLARDGFLAVKTLQKNKIDLVITDWELSVVSNERQLGLPPNRLIHSDMWSPFAPCDGACFVKYLRVSKYSPDPYIPIIMMTGLGIRDQIEYARDCGVNEILLKPLLMETLCERIAAVIDDSRPFVTAKTYKGPCRRRADMPIPGMAERRKHDIRLFEHTG